MEGWVGRGRGGSGCVVGGREGGWGNGCMEGREGEGKQRSPQPGLQVAPLPLT